MPEIGDSISVTPTPEGLSRKQIAVAVIADKLGIPESEVFDHTDLGAHYHEITTVVTFKTGADMIIANFGMTAEDLFAQL